MASVQSISHTTFEQYRHLLKETVPEDKENEYITLHWPAPKPIGFSKMFMRINDFNRFLKELIERKYSSGDKTGDKGFQLSIDNSTSILYIDCDYYVNNLSEEESNIANKKLATAFYHTVTSIDEFSNAVKMLFLPPVIEHDGNYKGGFHLYLFMYEAFSRSDKEKLITILNENISSNSIMREEFSNYSDKITNEENQQLNVTDLIDGPALSRCSSIMCPFAAKPNASRSYVLKNKQINANELIPIPTIEQYNSITKMKFKTFSNSKSGDIKDVDYATFLNTSYDDRRTQFTKFIIENFKEYNCCDNLKDLNLFIYDFHEGCSYLSENHPFLNLFKKGKWSECDVYIMKLIKFYFAMSILILQEIPNNFEDVVRETILRTLDVLFVVGGKTNRDDLLKCVDWCFNSIAKYNDNFFDPEKIETFIRFSHESAKSKEKERKADETSFKITQRIYATVKSKINHYLTDYCRYVIENILKELTNEIEPFDEHNRKRDIEKFDFKRLYSIPKVSDKCYDTALYNLNKMFLLCAAFEFNLAEGARPLITMVLQYLIQHYIYSDIDTVSLSKDAKKVYIYNIKQTDALEKYPYNQWIEDFQERNLDCWVRKVYKIINKPLEQRSQYDDEGGFNKMIKPLDEFNFLEKPSANKSAISLLSIPKNFNKIINSFKENIISETQSCCPYRPIKFEPTSTKNPYFAVRNGILEYYIEQDEIGRSIWKVRFLSNNKNLMINAYTLAKWNVSDCDDEVARAKVMRILEGVYPDPDERDYILKLFSSAVCPLITKDQILFVYGSGSDGKSTMNSILGTILGQQDHSDITCQENGVEITLFNPNGYASSLKSSAITTCNSNSSGHDEGGAINLENKSFAVMQEPPNSRINAETIKDWTSGGVSHGRAINQRDRKFKINSLICIETNNLPKYTAIDDAIRRRVIIYKHLTKFVTDANRNRYKNVEHWQNARPQDIRELNDSTECWNALLKIMVEKNLEVLNSGCFMLSNIPMPASVKNFTNATFGKVSGLASWLSKNVIANEIKEPNTNNVIINIGCLSISRLIDAIKDYNNRHFKDDPIIETRTGRNVNDEIISTIQNQYSGQIFVIKPDLIKNENRSYKINDGKDEIIEISNSKLSELLKRFETMSETEIIEKYTTTGHSITVLSDTVDRLSYRDLILPGLILAEDRNNKDEDE